MRCRIKLIEVKTELINNEEKKVRNEKIYDATEKYDTGLNKTYSNRANGIDIDFNVKVALDAFTKVVNFAEFGGDFYSVDSKQVVNERQIRLNFVRVDNID